MQKALERLTDGNDRSLAQCAKLASKVRQQGVVWQDEAQLRVFFTSLFMHHLVIEPKPLEAVRDALDFLVGHGASPFYHWDGRHMSIYQELIMAHPASEAVAWCRALPSCHVPGETDPACRLRSETLDAILMENFQPGSTSQLSALKLFGFPLLETWSDGQTTLDRVLYRYFKWNSIDTLGPRKDFELALVQRGFARLAKELQDQNPGSEHLHAIRWFARHHAQHCAYKLGRPDRYSKWGEESWQASVRNLDQVLCAVRKDIGKTPVQRNLVLREEGVDYALRRALPGCWAAIMASAAVYDLTDNDQAREASVLGKSPPHHDRRVDAAWQLRVASALDRAICGHTPSELRPVFEAEPSLLIYSRNMLSLLASDPQCATHDALVGACLPALASSGTWTTEMEAFEQAVLNGVRWPMGMPYDQWTQDASWRPSMLAVLDARTLSSQTPTLPPSRKARRI